MKKNLIIMYAIALLQGMIFYGPIATLYRQAQGVTVFQITVIESISLALGLLLEIPWGVIADKIGYHKTMVLFCGLFFVSKIVFWKATGFSGFLLERVMLSIVFAGFSGVDLSILYLSCKDKDSQRVFGIYDSMNMAGLLLAALVFSLFIKDNFPMAGFLTVISYGIAALLSLGLTEVSQTKQEDAQPEGFRALLWDTLRNRGLILFLIAVALLSETHQTITVFLNQLQYGRCGMDSTSIGFVYILATILGLLGVYSTAVTKRMPTMAAFALFGRLAAISCLVLALTTAAIPSVVSIMTLRATNTLFQPFQANIRNKMVQSKNRATALSIHSMVISFVSIGTNLIFGALSDWSLPVAFLFGGGICIVSLVFFFLWSRKS